MTSPGQTGSGNATWNKHGDKGANSVRGVKDLERIIRLRNEIC